MLTSDADLTIMQIRKQSICLFFFLTGTSLQGSLFYRGIVLSFSCSTSHLLFLSQPDPHHENTKSWHSSSYVTARDSACGNYLHRDPYTNSQSVENGLLELAEEILRQRTAVIATEIDRGNKQLRLLHNGNGRRTRAF